MNIKKTLTLFFLLLFLSSTGCAYRHYLGMHGPSITSSPEIHVDVQDDAECLECHDPQMQADAPPTNHPNFKGCLKCHNDAL